MPLPVESSAIATNKSDVLPIGADPGCCCCCCWSAPECVAGGCARFAADADADAAAAADSMRSLRACTWAADGAGGGVKKTSSASASASALDEAEVGVEVEPSVRAEAEVGVRVAADSMDGARRADRGGLRGDARSPLLLLDDKGDDDEAVIMLALIGE